ncbi:MAG: iron(III)-transport system permease, partial [Rhizobacter sp.]|nr:iron(III)-transport system permease [Rhizobacter sp.]
YSDLAGQREVLDLLVNTGIYVFGTIAFAVVFASVWAWITERTDFKYKVAVRVLMMLTFALPSLIQGLGWTLLLNPNNGFLNQLVRELYSFEGDTGPFNIYSMGMMVFVSGFLLTPPVYVMLAGVVRHLDYKLEFPAILAGVSPRRVLANIIIPVLLPGLLSVLIYTVMVMIQVFDIPLSIGLTGGIQVFSTRIYLLSSSDMGQPNYNLAAAFGVMLVLVAVALVLLYQRLTRLSERFAVISGKNYALVETRLGKRRYFVYAYATLYFLISFSPIFMLMWTSLLPFYSEPSMEALGMVSLKNYTDLFDSSLFRRGLGNTAITVLVGATVTMMVSLVIAYSTRRPIGFWRKAVDLIAFVPIGIPQIVLGLAVLLLYVRTPLYGTIAVIILAQMSVNMIFAVRTLKAGLIQISPDIERAAVVSGVGRTTIMTRIMAPIIKTQLFDGWLIVFAYCVRDIGVPLVFLTSETVVLGSALWLIWGYPNVPAASALSILIVVFLAVFLTPLQFYVSNLGRKATA